MRFCDGLHSAVIASGAKQSSVKPECLLLLLDCFPNQVEDSSQ